MSAAPRTRTKALARAVAGALLVVVCGCGSGSAPTAEGELIPASRVVLSYLARPDLMRPAGGGAAPSIDLLRPHGSTTMGGGQMPAIALHPPSDLRFEVPADLPSGAKLHVEMCVRRGHYRGTGAVRLRWSQGEDVLLERELPSGADTPNEERRWHAAVLAPQAGRELRLEVAHEGSEQPSSVCVAELEFREPQQVQRTVATPEAPNIVLIVIDTLRADRLATYGGPSGVSPNFDRLAESGVLFERAFVTAPWTAPATASILTALSPPQHGVGFGSSVLSPTITTIAETLQWAGFTTAGFSSNNLISKSRNFDQGFEHFFDYRWKESEDINGDIVDWIGEHDEHRFFLYLHYVDPHGPYEPAPQFADAYASTPPEGYEGETQKVLMERYMRGEGFEREFLDAVAEHNLVLYDGEIASVDASLGQLREALVARGLEDRTLVCVTSDHGEEFMEHGLMGHVKQLHDESVRVPLAFRGPGVPVGVRVPHEVQNQLVAPTLLRLAGVDVPEEWAQGDLMEIAHRAERSVEPVFFSTSRGRYVDPASGDWSAACRMHGVRAGRWLLIWVPEVPPQPEHHEFFDLETDPGARVDIAADHPKKVQALREQIQAWIARGLRADERIEVEGHADAELLRALGYIED